MNNSLRLRARKRENYVSNTLDYKLLKLEERPTPPGFTTFKHIATRALDTYSSLFYEVMFRGSNGSVDIFDSPMDARIWPLSAKYSLVKNAPLIHVSSDLCQAFLATAIPEECVLRIPYPAFYLSIPRGTLYSEKGIEITAILVADNRRVAEWHAVECDGQQALWETMLNRSISLANVLDLTVITYLADGATDFIQKPLDKLPLEANGGDFRVLDDKFYELREYTSTPDCTSSQLSARVAANAMLCLEHQPELFTEEEQSFGGHKGFGPSRDKVGTIRWLGRDYGRKTASSSSQGNGGGKRPHWRKGHWHTVLHGVGRQLRKLQWFQPLYVNGQGASE